MADRRWSYVGISVMVLGTLVLVVASFPQELGVPLEVPVTPIGTAIIALGVALYVLQRRAEQDGQAGGPPTST
jgi:uncharacterized membrane protein